MTQKRLPLHLCFYSIFKTPISRNYLSNVYLQAVVLTIIQTSKLSSKAKKKIKFKYKNVSWLGPFLWSTVKHSPKKAYKINNIKRTKKCVSFIHFLGLNKVAQNGKTLGNFVLSELIENSKHKKTIKILIFQLKLRLFVLFSNYESKSNQTHKKYFWYFDR